jgi:hypothetical protein
MRMLAAAAAAAQCQDTVNNLRAELYMCRHFMYMCCYASGSSTKASAAPTCAASLLQAALQHCCLCKFSGAQQQEHVSMHIDHKRYDV